MSLQFNATSDYATRTGMTISDTFTLMCQFMPEGTTTGWIMGIARAASGSAHSGIRRWYSSGHRCEISLAAQQLSGNTTTEAFTVDAWHSLAIVQTSGVGIVGYMWDASGTLKLTHTWGSAVTTNDLIWFGQPDQSRDGNATGNTGQFRYGKLWSGTALTSGELLTERTSATCVKAGGTSLWAFPDGTTGTDSIGSNTLTINSGSTGGNDPGYIGASGAGVAPFNFKAGGGLITLGGNLRN
jgi:hypothetical protein